MNNPLESESIDSPNDCQIAFNRLKAAYRRKPVISYEERIDTLKKIELILSENSDRIAEAVAKDYVHRSLHETKINEITVSVLGLRHTRKKLKKWMKPQKRPTSLLFMGAKNRVIPQAKGVVGMVVPWNFPVFISTGPLASAIAAGNRVMIKMASNSQNLCRLLHCLFKEKISEEVITFLPGARASDFSTLPFDHLIFTGSPEVGRTIMKNAAEHLTPVTLELGGKSPVILCDDFDLETAVRRITAMKYLNSGQICVNADYLFVPEGKVAPFIEIAKKVVSTRYPTINSPDYTSIIDNKAYQNLREMMKDAEEKKANFVNLLPGVPFDDKLCKISPTIVQNVTDEMRIMQEEIFGPLLPIMTYKRIEDVIEYINDRERPLALYVFSNNKKIQEQVLSNTISGGVSINDIGVHVAQHDMPFGGVGNSGMGQYHGFEGFLEFSKLRPIFTQAKKASSTEAPYGANADKAFNFIIKMKFLS